MRGAGGAAGTGAVAREMASSTPWMNSRWDQPKSKADVLQDFVGRAHPLPPQVVRARTSAGSVGASSSAVSEFPSSQSSERSDSSDSAPQGGVEMAAAMAAKINAMLMAKGKLKTLEPLPCKIAPCLPVVNTTEEVVVTEVDINDVPINCRNLLTKGKTQEEIRLYSGAVVSTKGLFMTSDERSSVKGDRPLYLHVQGRSQEEVNKAVMRIKEIISEDVMRAAAASGGQQRPVLPTVAVYPQPPRPVVPQQPAVLRQPNAHPAQQTQRPALSFGGHSGNFVHTKIFVGLDQALSSFNVKEKVEGPGGTYLGHVQTETGARVFLRGKGSGYIEQASRRESFEPLYIYISHPNSTGLETAKKLCESLLETVRAEHTRLVSVYTATSSTQAYPAHGYPANSNYSSQGSWYNYPANGYTGGYAAYPGASGYWSSANGHDSHSNMSTTPPSSQAMVQYPVCPRKPPPYLVQDQDTPTDEITSPLPSPQSSTSPKRRFLEDTHDDSSQEKEPESHVEAHSATPRDETKTPERILMPPPPAPAIAVRKRPRDLPPQDESHCPTGTITEELPKKPKLPNDISGLVPYGGDSSDEEEERNRCSKKANS
ncbi:KH homology domain-containing protein 4-like isoform X2 [Denticeps clupeoides]|uniref:KH homology domain-containing protein 4-like isoform X2 n=1 Tax=Denticeps clupeoides TaxID=299321 RepID=UPI0010A31AB0|nr:KH homology domain-containing protein 4-like isoform X2 [Denticeps clupeoides]